MGIYIQNANFKFLFNLKNNKFDNFCSNTIEKPLKSTFFNMSIISKAKLLKNTLLIMDNKNVIGYIWCDNLKDYVVYVKDICISKEYLDKSKKFEFDSSVNLKNDKVFYYDGYDLENFNSILLNLGFNISSKSLLKAIDFNSFNINNFLLDKEETYLINFIENKDELKRCNIQNDIFEDESRVPLTIDDIYLDEMQDYYLREYSFFLKHHNKCIGYGQIIKFNDIYLIVNLGIIPKYRGVGFGEYLLSSILKKLKDDEIDDEIFIRVSEDNNLAIKLYSKLGFKDKATINSYKL